MTVKETIRKKGLRVMRLTATNFKKLALVDITPKGSIVKVKGQNGSGKSTVLDALFAALGGANASPDVAIRKGQDQAEVKVDLETIIVRRRWSVSGTTLEITWNGEAVKQPQSLLDEFVGKATIDPGKFLALDDKAKKDILKSIVDLGIDLEKHEEKRQKLFEERTDVNRDEKKKRSHYESIEGDENGSLKGETATALMEKFEAAKDEIQEIKNKEASLDALNDSISANAEAISDTEEQIKNMEKDLKELREQREIDVKGRDKLAAVIKDIVAPDIEAIQEKVRTVDAKNKKVRMNQEKKKALTEADELTSESKRLSRRIEKMDEEKATALANAKFPVKGLSWSEDGIILDKLPFSQASQSKQLQIAVAISTRANPVLKVITIKDASLFDKNSIDEMKELADNLGITIWLEIVSNSGNGKLTIEEGE